MTSYSVQLRNLIFVKYYGFLSFVKTMRRHIGKNISKTLSSKYSKTVLVQAKQSATNAFKNVSKREIQKTEKSTGDLNEKFMI